MFSARLWRGDPSQAAAGSWDPRGGQAGAVLDAQRGSGVRAEHLVFPPSFAGPIYIASRRLDTT